MKELVCAQFNLNGNIIIKLVEQSLEYTDKDIIINNRASKVYAL